MSAPYVNRELSWLEFNQRVLSEGERPDLPLLERLKFLAITASNLDEFFQVRVAALKDQIAGGIEKATADGRSPARQLADIGVAVPEFVERLDNVFVDVLMPELRNIFWKMART